MKVEAMAIDTISIDDDRDDVDVGDVY